MRVVLRLIDEITEEETKKKENKSMNKKKRYFKNTIRLAIVRVDACLRCDSYRFYLVQLELLAADKTWLFMLFIR